MWLMATGTIFAHRGMFPDIRSPFFLMTLVAGFVNRCGIQKFWPYSAMRVMATRATQLSFSQGVMGGPLHEGSLLLVALETRILRVFGNKHGLSALFGHHIMALVETYPHHLMSATPPMHPRFALVTLQTNGALLLGGDCFEGNDAVKLFAQIGFLQMFA